MSDDEPDYPVLTPGAKYTIELDDCCIQGVFTGVFVGYTLDQDGRQDQMQFDIGTLGPYWGQWKVTEAPA